MRQGAILSPTLFLVVVDDVMRRVTLNKEGNQIGFAWTFIEDVKHGDYSYLLSQICRDMFEKIGTLHTGAATSV
jgi:hypothetical protein